MPTRSPLLLSVLITSYVTRTQPYFALFNDVHDLSTEPEPDFEKLMETAFQRVMTKNGAVMLELDPKRPINLRPMKRKLMGARDINTLP